MSVRRKRDDPPAAFPDADRSDVDGAVVEGHAFATRSDSASPDEIGRARRGDGPFVDVDGLKRVNDRDGQAAGDHVLRTLAATVRSNLRSFDPIVRYGGDDFVCRRSGVDPQSVERRFGAIDQELQDAVGVGITGGLASLAPNDTLDELISRADAALLDGKGRRVEPLDVIRPRVRQAVRPADSDSFHKADSASLATAASRWGGTC